MRLSSHASVRVLLSLLSAARLQRVVLCPGSRNAALVSSFCEHPSFQTYRLTDERSAGFFAIGLIESSGEPAAVCCTSGTALVNLHSAVSEAYYKGLPLLILSADRPAESIGQMEGQTLPQPGVFRSLVKASYQLPEIREARDEQWANRLINEALLQLQHPSPGPVHINIPLREPLFSQSSEPLAPQRRVCLLPEPTEEMLERFLSLERVMILIGQHGPLGSQAEESLAAQEKALAQLAESCVCVSEILGSPQAAISRPELLLYSLGEEQREALRPDLLISMGGHLLSKRLRTYLTDRPPQEHWFLSPDAKLIDSYRCLTHILELPPLLLLQRLAALKKDSGKAYAQRWRALSATLSYPEGLAYSALAATQSLLSALEPTDVLHLGNSSAVRYAALSRLPKGVECWANRGMNGIDGSLSTALGAAVAQPERRHFCLLGDLSFFYDMNALCYTELPAVLSIVLLNNGEGEIFRSLPSCELSQAAGAAVRGEHHCVAEGWARQRGLSYLCAHNSQELSQGMEQLLATAGQKPCLLEVFTEPATDIDVLKAFMRAQRADYRNHQATDL